MKIAFVPSPLARACRVLAALTVLAVVPQLAMANCNDTVGTKMSNILFGDSSGDTVVLAHRGLWGKYGNFPDMPENSRGALQLANDQCMDGVELDIKMTSDGVPVVLHDWNLGRTTNVWTSRAGETKYDPMSNQGYNPSITVTPWSVVSGLFLLTPDRRTTTGYHVPRVDELFSYFKAHGLKTPIVFGACGVARCRCRVLGRCVQLRRGQGQCHPVPEPLGVPRRHHQHGRHSGVHHQHADQDQCRQRHIGLERYQGGDGDQRQAARWPAAGTGRPRARARRARGRVPGDSGQPAGREVLPEQRRLLLSAVGPVLLLDGGALTCNSGWPRSRRTWSGLRIVCTWSTART
ncbi:glycerophosphodiester phosphodiesterase family protein [Pantoea ananatis]|uniref:glycerophosphodiester phosphodiesterase family protein n=1 Tax=Pantoea ananas TaxID=553 RepID=UPI002220B8F4|nr:glycerophosphodiester phosphodiesterase family protein [Pantoea ananatis]